MVTLPPVLFAAVIASRRLIRPSAPCWALRVAMLEVLPSTTSAEVDTVTVLDGEANTDAGRNEPDTAARTSEEPTPVASMRRRRDLALRVDAPLVMSARGTRPGGR